MRQDPPLICIALLALGTLLVAPVGAQTTWDGGGGADTSWGTSTNWDNNTLPAFNGTDSLTITSGFGVNTALTLGGDRSIGRLTFGGGATAISLSNDTLRLNSTTTSAGAGTALWNANTSDSVQATVNSNLLLQSGTAGSYTGYIRENNNSSGGTRFNGTITQGVGENWTLRFSRSAARGVFGLNNAGNSISAIRNDNADVYSEVVGSFGGASLTLAGGWLGTRFTDHYTTAVNNSITVAGNAVWASLVQTRLTGSLSQGSFTLTYGVASTQGSSSLTRLEYSSVTGSGTTVLAGGALSVSSMSQLASGTLDLGSSSSSSGVFVLSGSGGNGVPTWSDFSSARTFNQLGGANTWRINAGTGATNTGNFGGFAAVGADVTIPNSGAGLTNTTFARNFQLGSVATLNGSQYATNAVKIETDIAYGTVNGNRYFGVAGNQGSSRSATALTLTGPVHELAGVITGDNVNIYPVGQSNTQLGMVRFSNASNALTGSSRWIIGGNRSTFTTLAGSSIAASANMSDFSSVVAIFTSDAAFGGASEVNVASQSSSGSNPGGVLLFEDQNNSGGTTFTRNLGLQNNSQTFAAPAWGSYGGEVTYTGTATMGGLLAVGVSNTILHVQSGSMALGVSGGSAATITNNSAVASLINKSGAGTLLINNLTVNGTQATTDWNVRSGTLGGSGSVGGSVTVSSGANLAPGNSTGTLDIGGNLTLSSTSNLQIEIGGTTPGDGNSFYDQVNVVGNGLLTGSNLLLSLANSFSPTGSEIFYILTFGGTRTGSFAGLAEGATVTIGGYSGLITYEANWTGSQGSSSLTGGNDIAIHSLVIPEPSAVILAAFGLATVMAFRRRHPSRSSE